LLCSGSNTAKKVFFLPTSLIVYTFIFFPKLPRESLSVDVAPVLQTMRIFSKNPCVSHKMPPRVIGRDDPKAADKRIASFLTAENMERFTH
jgi:hypothetical protein